VPYLDVEIIGKRVSKARRAETRVRFLERDSQPPPLQLWSMGAL